MTLMNVSYEFDYPRACLLICAFVSYVEPHIPSFYLLRPSHNNTALTPLHFVVHILASLGVFTLLFRLFYKYMPWYYESS